MSNQSTDDNDRWELVDMFDGKLVFYRKRSVDAEIDQ